MNCQFCDAPFEEEKLQNKICPRCKGSFFIKERDGMNFVSEGIRERQQKIFNFSLKSLESQLDKSLKAEDFSSFSVTLCPFCSSMLYLKNLCDVLSNEKGIILKFPQKESSEVRCQWCGKINTQIKGGSKALEVFLPFKIKSEFEKNLEKFLSQPPISYEEKKGCLSLLLFFPFFR